MQVPGSPATCLFSDPQSLMGASYFWRHLCRVLDFIRSLPLFGDRTQNNQTNFLELKIDPEPVVSYRRGAQTFTAHSCRISTGQLQLHSKSSPLRDPVSTLPQRLLLKCKSPLWQTCKSFPLPTRWCPNPFAWFRLHLAPAYNVSFVFHPVQKFCTPALKNRL